MVFTEEQVKIIKQTIQDDGKLASIFNAVSDPTRCRTFRLLVVMKNRYIRVTDIAHIIGVSVPAISQHMKVLEIAGLVNKKKVGQTVYYTVKNEDLTVQAITKIVLKDMKKGVINTLVS